MKRIVTLTLSLILIVFYTLTSYAENNDLLMPVSDISVPVGGLSPYIQAEETDEDSFVSLDGIQTSQEFDKFFYDALYEQQQTINIYNYRIPYAGFQDWYVEFAFKHPELFLVDGGYSCNTSAGYVYDIYPKYYVNKSVRDAFITTMNQKLDEYYDLVKDEDDELKKYLLIHSKMIREAHYDYSYLTNPKAHTVYSFFTTGGTTCQGYANALKLIGDKVGLEVAYCFNRSSDVGHIWNYIKINDKWYHTDVTWDDYNASLTDGTHSTENDQGALHMYFLCSENTFSLNSHGNIYDFKTFGDKKTCNDTTYEDDKWAFNLLNNAGSPYLTDFDCNDENIFFDLVGAKDTNGNPLKFVTNNLWGNDTYISSPIISQSKATYCWFSKTNLPASKVRLVYKTDDYINNISSYDISAKSEYQLSSVQIPLKEEFLNKSNSITLYNWAGLKPLAEGNMFVSEDPNLPLGGNILLSSEDFNDISYTKTATENGLYNFENGILNLNVTATCDRDSNVYLKFNKQLEGTISEGDICMLTFKSKVNSGTPYLKWVVEHPETYKKALSQKVDVKNSSEWNTYYIPFKGIEGAGRVSLRFGLSVQNIDIKDFQLINYGKEVNIEDLPSTIIPNTPEPTTYTVTFNTNGGSSVSSQTVNEGERVSRPSNPTREGHSFVMWTKDGVEYNFNDAVNSNITLAANWTKNKYLVAFDFNEGTLNGESYIEQEVYWNELVSPPENPQKESTSAFTYEFAGYTLSKNGNEFFNFDTEITDNIVLYAKWTEVPINVDQTELLLNLNGIINNFNNYPYDVIYSEELLLKVLEFKEHMVTMYQGAIDAINRGELVSSTFFKEHYRAEEDAIKTLYDSLPDEGANSLKVQFDNIFFEIGDTYLTYIVDYFGVTF